MVYRHAQPRWIQFVYFLYAGFFNGYTNFKLSRIFCWYGLHKWNKHKYMKWENGKETGEYDYQCLRCCSLSEKYND